MGLFQFLRSQQFDSVFFVNTPYPDKIIKMDKSITKL